MTKNELFQGFLRAEKMANKRGRDEALYVEIAESFGILEGAENYIERIECDALYQKLKDTFEYRLFVASRSSDEEGQT